MRKILVLVIMALAVILAAGCSSDRPPAPAAAPAETGVTVGKAAPRFTLPDVGGATVTAPVPDRITVLNFWATWCPPCRQEMPELQRFLTAHGSRVAFYSVNVQEPADRVGAFLRQNGLSIPALLDKGDVAELYRINSIPTTVVLDKQGIIRYRKIGPVTAAELEGVIRGL